MKRFDPLYTATAATAMFCLLAVGYFILQSAKPSADVVALFNETHPTINTADFTAGTPTIVTLNRLPVIIWHRNTADIALAKKQDNDFQWLSEFSIVSSNPLVRAKDINLTHNHEWFFAWAKNPTRFGCLVIPQMGDFHGFFDPCRGMHFDMAGRIQRGPSRKNLHVIAAKISADGKHFQLDLTNPPKVNY
jgi:ubiquinol-cytochrome c reductase iron-sulfur subunit